MRIQDIQTLYAYNAWANTRILDTAARLSAEHYANATFSTYHLRDTLEHILVVESIWRLRCQGIEPATVAFPDAFPTLEALRTHWHAEEQQLQAFLATLSNTDMDRLVSYLDDDGASETWTLWHLLLHAVNHGTQHRSEAAMVLTEQGHSPGALDLAIFIRQHGM